MSEREIVKSVSITSEQVKELRRTFRRLQAVDDQLAELIWGLVDRMVDHDNRKWDEVSKLLGYDSFDECLESGIQLNVNYVQRTVQAFRRKETTND